MQRLFIDPTACPFAEGENLESYAWRVLGMLKLSNVQLTGVTGYLTVIPNGPIEHTVYTPLLQRIEISFAPYPTS